MTLYHCTEPTCPRWAVVTIIDDQSGAGGHLCLEHAEVWAARFLQGNAGIRVRIRDEVHAANTRRVSGAYERKLGGAR